MVLIEMREKSRKEIAMDYFLQGYNCSQSLVLTFSDAVDVEKDTLSRLSCGFGGGMSRLREVCGSVSGMFLIADLLYGYSGPETGQVKKDQYARIQELAHRFEEKNGSIICRDLLGLKVQREVPDPSARTDEYYKKRPCKEIIGSAAEILEKYILEQNPDNSSREERRISNEAGNKANESGNIRS